METEKGGTFVWKIKYYIKSQAKKIFMSDSNSDKLFQRIMKKIKIGGLK